MQNEKQTSPIPSDEENRNSYKELTGIDISGRNNNDDPMTSISWEAGQTPYESIRKSYQGQDPIGFRNLRNEVDSNGVYHSGENQITGDQLMNVGEKRFYYLQYPRGKTKGSITYLGDDSTFNPESINGDYGISYENGPNKTIDDYLAPKK